MNHPILTKYLPEDAKIKQVILQPTPYCNLRCKYCYLPDRGNTSRMSVDLPKKALEYILETGIADKTLEIRWHAGEPLAAGIDFYKKAIAQIEEIVPESYRLIHTLQTNATLVNEEWCAFFKEKNFFVGVSIDGPQFLHDNKRVFKSGKGSYDLTLKGLNLLKESGVNLNAIAVITTESLDYPNEIYDFFSEIGIGYLGINVEETEGINESNTMQAENFEQRYRDFFEILYKRHLDGPVIIREAEQIEMPIKNNIRSLKSSMAEPFFVFCVDHKGNFSSFSPEFVGMEDKQYGDFNFGNIYTDKFEDVIASEKFQRVYQDILVGTKKCKESCEYYVLCGGGSPGNKLYETGSFKVTETGYCKARTIIPTDVILPVLEARSKKRAYKVP